MHIYLCHVYIAGSPSSFDITVRPAASISVDMYILLDLSFTMRQQLTELRSFARELGVCVSCVCERKRGVREGEGGRREGRDGWRR